jgi:hypothetical protein
VFAEYEHIWKRAATAVEAYELFKAEHRDDYLEILALHRETNMGSTTIQAQDRVFSSGFDKAVKHVRLFSTPLPSFVS